MARNVWTGTISFGLVNVPVALQTAVTEKKVRFHQLNEKTGGRVKQKRVDADTGDEVAFEDIVKGYELSPDRYVMVSPEELEGLAPKKTKMIELEQFSPEDEINPVAYDSHYNVVPQAGGEKGYRLLAAAMSGTRQVGLGKFVLRSKECMVALRVVNGGMTLSTLNWADEINPPPAAPEGDPLDERELTMATALLEAMSRPFVHGDFVDEYRSQVLDLIERKAGGEEVVGPPEEPAQEQPSASLLQALEATLAQFRSDPGEPSGRIKATDVPEEERAGA